MPDRMPRRLAICPCPPALLPAATGRSLDDAIERLRGSAQAAVDWLCEAPGPVVVLTSGEHGLLEQGTELSADAFGLAYRGRLGGRDAAGLAVRPRTPGLLVASVLLRGRPALGIEIGADGMTAQVRAALADADPAAILVCGGGSARRRDGAPGYIDERAVPFDDRLADDIARGDVARLQDADLPLADELLCDLSRPLSVAARLASDWPGTLRASVDSFDAPFGVANIVARWWVDA